ncbi:CAAD domain-containing protein [Nostocaceae cyanobacterium CENA357]|uniref:CAAD domain-containing protein n=1 Tax=Atlanticothrix silvestris CENA357 TaxID=1725252 RepID=A0A8J7L1W5_9CYAN|nr:CAAD domain-containing protein [Atlanticothrix silvestris]MBH8553715.1 CAAD domain-containing protein [Atlanticothrix silvestris CENA357]
METEQQQLESVDIISQEGMLALQSADNQDLPKLPPAKEPESQWREMGRKTAVFLAQLPDYFSRFFQNYKQLLITVFLILAAIVTGKVLLSMLAAINDIPLLSPIFELIGLSYSTWFVFRYLVKSSTRQELAEEIQSLKQQILGESITSS